MEKLINIHSWIGKKKNCWSIENHHRDSEQFTGVVLEICGRRSNLNICDIHIYVYLYLYVCVKLNLSEKKESVC